MSSNQKNPEKLRSSRWYGPDDLRSFGHRSRTKQMGYLEEEFVDKPVIGIINTWNEMNSCHTHFPERVKDVKRGVFSAGGFPVELPAISLGEQLMKPTAMMYRNFLSMEVEELLRSYPIDGAVLMGGCDKTTPGVLLGAISMNLPCIFVPGGAMIKGHWRDKTLGSGTDVWKYWDDRRSGKLSKKEWFQIEDGIARSPGTCMTMGTAATMMSIADSLGMTIPGASSIPAIDSNHNRMASMSGRRAVDLVWENIKPTDILTEDAFENAIIVQMAIGGSTNGIIHLTALAKRAAIKLDLEKFDRISKQVPLIANLKPSGEYLMEDFYYAGGLLALMKMLKDHLNLDAVTVNGNSVKKNIESVEVFNKDVIRSTINPIIKAGGTAILKGTLAPNGAVIKPTAADKRLWKHKGPAVVFKDIRDLKARIDSDELEVSPDSILVLQNSGPIGGPGMPEWGQLPIPKKLLKKGVVDMVRISDARMSGTSYGACVLHVSPESALGGPLALVKDEDIIELDIEKREINLLVKQSELDIRKKNWTPPENKAKRGYTKLFTQHVSQANEGCDFDFLQGTPGENPEPDIF